MFAAIKILRSFTVFSIVFVSLFTGTAVGQSYSSGYPHSSSLPTASPSFTSSPVFTSTPASTSPSTPTPTATPEQCPTPEAMDFLEAETNVIEDDSDQVSTSHSQTTDWLTETARDNALFNNEEGAGTIEPITTAAEILSGINTTDVSTTSKLTDCGLLSLVKNVSALDLNSRGGIEKLLQLLRQHSSLSESLESDAAACGLTPNEASAVATALTLSPNTTTNQVEEKRNLEREEFRNWFDKLSPGIQNNVAAISQNSDGSKVCTECGCGNNLSITIYFHGIGDFSSAYAESERRAIKKMARDIENSTDPCCVKILLVAKMRFDNIQDTAELIAQQIAEELKKLQTNPNSGGSSETLSDCLRKINFHLVAFSQGGLVAVTVAPKIPCSIYVGPRSCCGIPKSPVIPIKVDIVTIDSPFNFVNLLPGLDTFAECSTWAIEQCLGHIPCVEALTWWCSTGAENYGGEPPSRCICGKTSFYKNYTAAGKDPKLDDWKGWCDIPIDDSTTQGTPMEHNDTVDWVMEKYYDDLIKPRCSCNKTSNGCDG